MGKNKLIIFDMGNTLLDFHSGKHTDNEKDNIGIRNIQKYLFEKHNISFSEKSIKEGFIDIWYGDFYKREQLIELDVSEYFNDFLEENQCYDKNMDSLELMREFYKPYMEEVIVNHGAKKVMEKLNNDFYIGVLSNCILYDEIYKEVFLRKGLKQYIDKFIFSYSRKIRKPDERLFREMIDFFKIAPQNIYMVGDNICADIIPAKILGMKTIWYNKKRVISEYKDIIDYEIESLEEILEICKIY